MNHWIRPSCDSRTGASHLRRGAPCQDASGRLGFHDAAGSPIQVLVVSDGHGGARYVRSDVGARLACAVAMRELQQALAPARVAHVGALEEWRHWLAAELPARIVQAWRREVEAHWRSDPAADGSAFSPLVYGATLGVLLLTPAWWAHTGLGDWDLVRIGADGGEGGGGEALVSEEPECEGGGEATFSLCLEGAERHFAPRTALHPLTAEDSPFALLLATDGLRKSCGSDADFLTLCRYLAGLSPSRDQAGSAELAAALDHISRQGSGDDISVAVARWAPALQGTAWPQPGHQEPALLVQSSAGPASPSPPAAETAAATVTPAVPAMAVPPLPPVAAAAGSDRRRLRPPGGRPPSRPGRRLVLLAAGLALGGAALLTAAGRGLGWFAARPEWSPLVLTPQQRSDLRRQVQQLCEAPAAQPAAQDRAGGPLVPDSGSRSSRDPDRAGSSPAAAASANAALPSRVSSQTALPATGASAKGAGEIAAAALDPRRQQRIAATLASRASVFRSLRDGDPARRAVLLARSHADPLSALIAASASDAGLNPAASPAARPGPLQQLGRRLAALSPWVGASRRRPAAGSPLAQLGACPELHQALRASWQRLAAGHAASQALQSAAPASAASPSPGPAARGERSGLAPRISGLSPQPVTSSR